MKEESWGKKIKKIKIIQKYKQVKQVYMYIYSEIQVVIFVTVKIKKYLIFCHIFN